MAEKYNEWEQAQIGDFQKRLDNKGYCQLCGKEIIAFSGQLDQYEMEVKEEAHIECIRRYQAERNERYRQEQERQSKDTK